MRSALIALLAAATLAASAADAKVLITIDKSTQRMTVAVDGVPRWHWPVSTGRRGHTTPSGSFTAFRMEKDHFSREWDDAPMPHSIFFTKKGHAIHGSYDVKRIGTPASAGCVRLHPSHAAQLFALVERQGVLNTTVVVAEGTPAVARQAPAPAREYQQEYQREPAPQQGYGPRYGPYAPPAYGYPPPPPGYGYPPQPRFYDPNAPYNRY